VKAWPPLFYLIRYRYIALLCRTQSHGASANGHVCLYAACQGGAGEGVAAALLRHPRGLRGRAHLLPRPHLHHHLRLHVRSHQVRTSDTARANLKYSQMLIQLLDRGLRVVLHLLPRPHLDHHLRLHVGSHQVCLSCCIRVSFPLTRFKANGMAVSTSPLTLNLCRVISSIISSSVRRYGLGRPSGLAAGGRLLDGGSQPVHPRIIV
jgi:hypothetical protein